MHHNISRGDLRRRRAFIIAVVAAALSLSGCVPIPYHGCAEVVELPMVETSVLEPGAERDPGRQRSLVFGRLVVKRGDKELPWHWRVVQVRDDRAVGILQEHMVSGSMYYLLVPPGEYSIQKRGYVEVNDPNVWFDVPGEPAAYYLGTLVPQVDQAYQITKVDIVDEFDSAVAELRHRNPQFAGLAQRRLMRSGAPTRQFTESCGWGVCVITPMYPACMDLFTTSGPPLN